MDPLANPKAFSKELVNRVLASAQLARSINYEEMLYYSSVEPDLKPLCENLAQKLLDITQLMLNTQPSPTKIVNLTDPDDVADKYDDIIDATDLLLEDVDLDNITQAADNNANTVVKSIEYGAKVYHTFQPQSGAIERPQLKFEPINNSPTPFIPKIKHKPNALKTLDEVFKQKKTEDLSDHIRNHISSLGVDTNVQSWPHPYEYEIDHFQYLERQLTPRAEKLYGKLENTPCSLITTPKELKLLSDKLQRVEEFAIDLEQHSYYTFLGFVCLMQISTRSEDFLIDTIELRNEMNILNESFTNPKIVKVLHGSDSDIVWLQRDFGLYIVNMFDTGQASRVLEYPKFSLAYLLDYFCSVKADKQFQLADWRVRPLPSELYNYARTDTHYLLYIYDRMHNELITKGNRSNNLLLAVLNRSRELCKKRFEKESIQYLKDSLYNKINISLTPPQMKVLDAVFEWRDRTARMEDQSVAYILPNHMLLKIAEASPDDKNTLFRICKPAPTPCLKSNFEDVLRVIRDAKSDAPKVIAPVAKVTMPTTFIPTVVNHLPHLHADLSENRAKTPDINQDQLFQQADWLAPSEVDVSRKRSAEFDVSNTNFNIANSPSSNLFSFNTRPLDKQKIEKIHANITAKTTIFPQSFAIAPIIVSEKIETQNAKEEIVPQSMEEIYQLSNQNRKRNKEKKKLKEDSLASNSNSNFTSPLGEFDPKEDGEKMSEEGGENGGQDTQEFMKKIGWLSESQQEHNKQKKLLKSNHHSKDDSSIKHNNSNNNNNNNKKYQKSAGNKTFPPKNSNFQSFDYSKTETKTNYGLGGDDKTGQSNRSFNNTSISVPNMGRSQNNRANNRGGKGRSQIFKGNNSNAKGNNKF